ncbi:hypothetical protein [Methanothrix sp.]|uniref:hypothetical protein n=1 Tax=Methanothrix sp. TaxID=90426 RepID=UPI0034E2099E
MGRLANACKQDPDALLDSAKQRIENELRDAGRQLAELIVPVKDGDAWVPAFDSQRLDEVAEIAHRIEDLRYRLGAIESDRELLREILEEDTLDRLRNERDKLRSQRARVDMRMRALRRRLAIKHHNEIAAVEDPEYLEAQEAASQELNRINAVIASLDGRIERIESIVKKWGASAS